MARTRKQNMHINSIRKPDKRRNAYHGCKSFVTCCAPAGMPCREIKFHSHLDEDFGVEQDDLRILQGPLHQLHNRSTILTPACNPGRYGRTPLHDDIDHDLLVPITSRKATVRTEEAVQCVKPPTTQSSPKPSFSQPSREQSRKKGSKQATYRQK
jgi:hypothetical protein